MRREVVLTRDAERDLQETYTYIAQFDSIIFGDRVLNRILTELHDIGMQEFRQVFFKPYRVIYRTLETRVVIYLIIDGRRDLQSVLAQRLLRG